MIGSNLEAGEIGTRPLDLGIIQEPRGWGTRPTREGVPRQGGDRGERDSGSLGRSTELGPGRERRAQTSLCEDAEVDLLFADTSVLRRLALAVLLDVAVDLLRLARAVPNLCVVATRGPLDGRASSLSPPVFTRVRDSPGGGSVRLGRRR